MIRPSTQEERQKVAAFRRTYTAVTSGFNAGTHAAAMDVQRRAAIRGLETLEARIARKKIGRAQLTSSDGRRLIVAAEAAVAAGTDLLSHVASLPAEHAAYLLRKIASGWNGAPPLQGGPSLATDFPAVEVPFHPSQVPAVAPSKEEALYNLLVSRGFPTVLARSESGFQPAIPAPAHAASTRTARRNSRIFVLCGTLAARDLRKAAKFFARKPAKRVYRVTVGGHVYRVWKGDLARIVNI